MAADNPNTSDAVRYPYPGFPGYWITSDFEVISQSRAIRTASAGGRFGTGSPGRHPGWGQSFSFLHPRGDFHLTYQARFDLSKNGRLAIEQTFTRGERPLAHHELKTWPDPFDAVWKWTKRAEFRRNDRNFRVEDAVTLREWVPETGEYTGREIYTCVLDVRSGPAFGIPEGYAMLSLAEGTRWNPRP